MIAHLESPVNLDMVNVCKSYNLARKVLSAKVFLVIISVYSMKRL